MNTASRPHRISQFFVATTTAFAVLGSGSFTAAGDDPALVGGSPCLEVSAINNELANLEPKGESDAGSAIHTGSAGGKVCADPGAVDDATSTSARGRWIR